MPWLQLRIRSNRERVSALESALLASGAMSVTFEDSADEPIYEPELGETPLWLETRVTGLFDADVDTRLVTQQIQTRLASTLRCQWEILEDKDWQREWLLYFEPIQCGENFWVCPRSCDTPDASAINLILDPGLAFGTGTHPTTFMCLKWISQQNFDNKTVIDYGCGSGILGIAALLHGATKAIGIDIDPQALLATKENVQRNGLNENGFQVYLPDSCNHSPADIVFANILAGPLVDLAPQLIALTKPGGQICLSGILSSQLEPIICAYGQYFMIDKAVEKDEWICLTGTRKTG